MSNARLAITRFLARLGAGLEVALVALLLGLGGMLILPQVSRASQKSEDATLADCLRYLRTQIEVYALEHRGVAPGFADGNPASIPDSASFLAQLIGPTDESGRTLSQPLAPGARGPYLAFIPANPITLRTGVLVVSGGMPAPDRSQQYGWFYCPRTRQIMPNLQGADAKGVAYSNY